MRKECKPSFDLFFGSNVLSVVGPGHVTTDKPKWWPSHPRLKVPICNRNRRSQSIYKRQSEGVFLIIREKETCLDRQPRNEESKPPVRGRGREKKTTHVGMRKILCMWEKKDKDISFFFFSFLIYETYTKGWLINLRFYLW